MAVPDELPAPSAPGIIQEIVEQHAEEAAFLWCLRDRATDDPARAARTVDYRIAWRPGTRRARSFEVDLAMAGGETLTLGLEPLLDFQMLGLGYLHPEWGHGLWKGESADALEHWAVPVSEPLSPHYLHIQSLCRAELGDRVGMGVLEQLVIGPHAPSGFKAMLDGAP